jgi:hypothetical protein
MFFAEPYFLKMRFDQPLVEGPLTKITVVSDSELVLCIGKMDYKQVFSGLEEPEKLV